ncbi:nucleotidyltransferase domain-containing protein [Moorella naiadis]|uniref:type VII toxin-antitoxin system MntA family adenylyltransferase antitoxin n=1 Tax=Moorella naiadis (nom. illeg.) TaxID=3093670 RepID=UPI003D9C9A13
MHGPKNLPALGRVFQQYPEIVAVYLFGSYLSRSDQARDVDLAVLLREPAGSITTIYMSLYPQLGEIFSPLEVDLLFLNSATISMAFEVISTGRVIYCQDTERRTDFEYVISGLYMDYDYHLQQGRRELYEAIKEAAAFV